MYANIHENTCGVYIYIMNEYAYGTYIYTSQHPVLRRQDLYIRTSSYIQVGYIYMYVYMYVNMHMGCIWVYRIYIHVYVNVYEYAYWMHVGCIWVYVYKCVQQDIYILQDIQSRVHIGYIESSAHLQSRLYIQDIQSRVHIYRVECTTIESSAHPLLRRQEIYLRMYIRDTYICMNEYTYRTYIYSSNHRMFGQQDIYIYIYICTYLYTYLSYIYVCRCISIYMHAYICKQIFIYAYTQMYVFIHIYVTVLYLYMCLRVVCAILRTN